MKVQPVLAGSMHALLIIVFNIETLVVNSVATAGSSAAIAAAAAASVVPVVVVVTLD